MDTTVIRCSRSTVVAVVVIIDSDAAITAERTFRSAATGYSSADAIPAGVLDVGGVAIVARLVLVHPHATIATKRGFRAAEARVAEAIPLGPTNIIGSAGISVVTRLFLLHPHAAIATERFFGTAVAGETGTHTVIAMIQRGMGIAIIATLPVAYRIATIAANGRRRATAAAFRFTKPLPVAVTPPGIGIFIVAKFRPVTCMAAVTAGRDSAACASLPIVHVTRRQYAQVAAALQTLGTGVAGEIAWVTQPTDRRRVFLTVEQPKGNDATQGK